LEAEIRFVLQNKCVRWVIYANVDEAFFLKYEIDQTARLLEEKNYGLRKKIFLSQALLSQTQTVLKVGSYSLIYFY
jgi:hypothetical protein